MGEFQRIRKRFMAFVLILVMLLTPVVPACSAEAEPEPEIETETAIHRVTGEGMVIEMSGEPSETESDELLPRGTARSGKYTGNDGSSIKWSLTSGGALTVSGSGTLRSIWYTDQNKFFGKEIKTVTIKSGITAIDDGAFANCTNITKVTLPASLEIIGVAAFALCTKLAAISIPSNVSYIGEDAFYSCSALETIELPSSVTLVDMEAFAACTALTSATVYGDIARDAFNNCTSLSSLTLGGAPQFIGDTAFAYCTSLVSVSIPSSVVEIGLGAFAYCESLNTAVINGNLLESAFDCCYTLTNVTIINNCQDIGRRAFAECHAMTSLSLPAMVTEIGEIAFLDCDNLHSISLPSGLRTLSRGAFYGCLHLASITIPSSITKIEDYLFGNCTALSTVKLHNGITAIGEGAFGNCVALSSISIPSACKSIGSQAFYGCKVLNSITIPSGTPAIEEGTFFHCESLRSINLPVSVKSVGDHAFSGCVNLASVSLGGSLTSIGKYSFSSCENLVTISLPQTLTSIGEGAFQRCVSLQEILIPNGVKVIPDGMLYDCVSVHYVTLSSRTEAINNWAFMNCSSLTGISIPDSTTHIGTAAFAGCKTLDSVILPASVTTVPLGLFMECERLQSVTAKGSINEVGDYAFAGCEELRSLNGFSSARIVGKYAFENDSNLQDFYFTNLESIGEAAFAFCKGLRSVSIGANASSIGDLAFAGCSGLQSIQVASGNNYYTSDGHILYTKDMTSLIACVSDGSLYSVVVPDTVQTISKYAFYKCADIQSIVLPSGITRIEDDMFFGCTGLRNITIPSTVSYIGQYAFANCEYLQDIVFPTALTQVGEGAFMGCFSLRSVNLNDCSIDVIPSNLFMGCTALRDIEIPDTVTFIGEYAFAGCTFGRELKIPDSVTEIADFAFSESKGIVNLILPEEVVALGRCAFAASENLASVSFNGDVYAVGAGAFENTPLEDVYFAGNAPGVIGENAFLDTREDLVFHYNKAGEGWETPVWIGPDNKTYNTSIFVTGTCGKKAKWKLDTYNGLLTISGTGATYNLKSAAKAPWYEYKTLIKYVVIEEGITAIGSNAFAELEALLEVSIPSSVTKVEYGAFANSRNIRTVNTNGGLKSVSKCMFYNCDQITAIELAEGITTIGSYAFYNCENLREVVIPSTVTKIYEGAFAACLSLEIVQFKGTIEAIGKGAFFNCPALTSIYVMKKVPQSVGNYAFSACNPNLSVYGTTSYSWLKGFSGTAETVASNTFGGTCGSLTWSVNPSTRTLSFSGNGEIPGYPAEDTPWYQYYPFIYHVEIGSGVTAIGDYALAELINVNSIAIPDTVTSIGKYAFAACSSLLDIHLPGNLSFLGEGAFSTCISLEDMILPGGITSIEAYTFSECLQLRAVTSESNIESVGYGAFYCCKQLEYIPFISSVSYIGSFAFTLCTGLQSVDLYSCITIGNDAFFCCSNLKNIRFSERLSVIGKKAFSQSGLTRLAVPRNLKVVPESAFELCDNLTTLSFEGTDHSVETDAFYGCCNLENLNLEGVNQIGLRSFMACGLHNVHISQTVTDIEWGAFADCGELSNITSDSPFYVANNGILYSGTELLQFPAGKNIGGFAVPAHVTSIAPYAFYGCERLVEVGIGERVISIGDIAFAYCSNLQYVAVGSKISNIPMAAFGNCPKLELVCFTGNAPSSIGENAFDNCPGTLMFEYNPKKAGWTAGSWTGPDGNTYATRTTVMNVTVVNSFFDTDGSIHANIRLSNSSSSSLKIQSLQINDDRFSVTGGFPLTIPAGAYDQSVEIYSTESLIGGGVICMATITVNGRNMNIPVKFTPQDDYYIWANAEGAEADAQVFNATETDRQVCVVAALQSDAKTVATRSHNCIISAGGYHNFKITFGGLPNSANNHLVLYVLDANTHAPIGKPVEISEFQATCVDGTGFVSIFDEDILIPRGTESMQDDLIFYSIDESVAPADAQGHPTSQNVDLGSFLISRTISCSDPYDYSELIYDIHISGIEEFLGLYQRNSTSAVEGITDDDIRTVTISVNVGISHDAPSYERGLTENGENGNSNAFMASITGTAPANIRSLSIRDGFIIPDINLGGSSKEAAGQEELINRKVFNLFDKDYNVGGFKVKVTSDLKVLEVGPPEIGFVEEGVGVEGSVGMDVAKIEGTVSISRGGYDLVSFSANGGLSAAAEGTLTISPNKIKIKLGAKFGGGAGAAVEINPVGILHNVYDISRDMAKRMLNSMSQRIRVYKDNKDGQNELIASGGFAADSDGIITSGWLSPLYYSSVIPGDSLYKLALPTSSGGITIPADTTTTFSDSSGKIDVKTIVNNLTAAQRVALLSNFLHMPVMNSSKDLFVYVFTGHEQFLKDNLTFTYNTIIKTDLNSIDIIIEKEKQYVYQPVSLHVSASIVTKEQ